IILMTADEIFETGQKASSHGLSLAIHAIGDRANRVVLDGYEKLRAFEKDRGYTGLQHRIEHVQLLHPDDYPRLAELGIIGSMQPIHCTSDMYISDRYWGKRAAGAYAFRTLLDQNTRLIFGSDAPVETPNPFVGIHAAVTRRRADGTPGPDGWNPQEKLPLHEVLHAYTAAPALSSGFGRRLGTLTSGSFADLIVLNQDPFEIQAQDLHLLSPDATMVGGTWVWSKPG
ncbi:MAG: amidohydrolase family protein, partial [Anaerolineaceae bacterium]